jgi:hypothetical protein
LIKGIFGSLFGREKKDEETPDYDDYEELSEPSELIEPSSRDSWEIVCSSCGARNLLTQSVGECDFCGSRLIYSAEDITEDAEITGTEEDTEIEDTEAEFSEAAAKTQNGGRKIKPGSDKSGEHTLTTGFYTAGIDIPVGTCNVTAVSGTGNLYSSDGGINEVFGVDDGDVRSFKGLKLRKNVCLTVSGELTVKLAYRSIEQGFSGRTYDKSRATKLSAGNYEAGSDFKAGIYKIVAVSGSGNLYSEDVDVNEVVGLEEGDAPEIMNVDLPKGAGLSIEGDLTVKLIPEVRR